MNVPSDDDQGGDLVESIQEHGNNGIPFASTS
jgi:hypothetical protein